MRWQVTVGGGVWSHPTPQCVPPEAVNVLVMKGGSDRQHGLGSEVPPQLRVVEARAG